MLIFNMTCKTTGWCAVAFTTNPGGRNMVNYDIALGGVASGLRYLDVSLCLQLMFIKLKWFSSQLVRHIIDHVSVDRAKSRVASIIPQYLPPFRSLSQLA